MRCYLLLSRSAVCIQCPWTISHGLPKILKVLGKAMNFNGLCLNASRRPPGYFNASNKPTACKACHKVTRHITTLTIANSLITYYGGLNSTLLPRLTAASTRFCYTFRLCTSSSLLQERSHSFTNGLKYMTKRRQFVVTYTSLYILYIRRDSSCLRFTINHGNQRTNATPAVASTPNPSHRKTTAQDQRFEFWKRLRTPLVFPMKSALHRPYL